MSGITKTRRTSPGYYREERGQQVPCSKKEMLAVAEKHREAIRFVDVLRDEMERGES